MATELYSLPAAPTAGLGMAIAFGLADMLERRDTPPADLVRHLRGRASSGLTAAALFSAATAQRGGDDRSLFDASVMLGLTLEDIAALALARALETDPLVASALRALQGETFGAWPSMALFERLLTHLEVEREDTGMCAHRMFQLGMLVPIGERAPLPEQRFALSDALRCALGLAHAANGLPRVLEPSLLPAHWHAVADDLAQRLGDRAICLVLRKGDRKDRLHFGVALAQSFGRQAMVLPSAMPNGGEPPGLGAAFVVARWLPVEEVKTLAGRRSPMTPLVGYSGPRVIIANSEGGLEAAGHDCLDIALPALTTSDRHTLWVTALAGERPPAGLAQQRFGVARIQTIAARALAAATPLAASLRAAMGEDLRPDMEPHARLVDMHTEDAELVAGDSLRENLDVLLARCRYRLTARAEDNPVAGIRVLFSGPSGTGKTLACSWLATRLGLPLFKLDLAAVVSKYIGETEENLAALLDRAESAAMVLLMDEADSIFGARTETKDSSDRFANNQTNYLLTRIESFDGIIVLTTNGRERFDSAFARRLDQIIEVPLPGARERRAIWRHCLGSKHALSASEINRLSALIDLAGGHIRNIAHTAQILAHSHDLPLSMADIRIGIHQEYKKIGKTPPAELSPT